MQRSLTDEIEKNQDLQKQLSTSNSRSEKEFTRNELLQGQMSKLESELSTAVESSDEQLNELAKVKKSVEKNQKQLTDTNSQMSLMQSKCFNEVIYIL